MAAASKIRALHLVPRPLDDARIQPIAVVPQPLKPGFATSPNRRRVDGFGKSIEFKGPSPLNRSLRPVLSLTLLCDAMQIPKDQE